MSVRISNVIQAIDNRLLERLASIKFPDTVTATPCKRVTHRYVELTSHGAVFYPVSFNRTSRLTITHEYCVSNKTNELNSFAIRAAQTTLASEK